MACNLQEICHRQKQHPIFHVGFSMKRNFSLKIMVPFCIEELCFPGILFENYIGSPLSKIFFQKEGAFRAFSICILKRS